MQSNKSNGQLTAQVNVLDHKKSGFDLSNNVLGTGKIGRIIPTRALHVMPGDTIKQDSKVAVQFEPLAVPILANMDVKQEHFYVPYNIVWKNWDNFISGGEQMNYRGVVPNTSMRGIIKAVGSVFTYLNFDFGFRQDAAAANSYYLKNYDDYLKPTATRNLLEGTGNAYKIRDLLKPQLEVYRLLAEFISRINVADSDDVVHNELFVEVSSNHLVPELRFNHDMEEYGLLGDKYMNLLRNKLIKDFYSQEGIKFYIPNSQGMEFLHLVYEFYRPFIGYGSNIDYLNMGRVSFVEFLYSFIIYMNDRDGSSDWHFELDLLQSMFSDSPLSILHLRANYSVWYNNYRDILLEGDVFEPTSTDDVTTDELFVLLVPRQRCWEKDAFTTALDNPCTGNVGVPITRETGTGYVSESMKVKEVHKLIDNNVGSQEGADNDMEISEISFGGESWRIPTAFLSGNNEYIDKDSNVSGFSLYALDAAKRAQSWLQKALLFGNRISDFYYLRFGVRYLDARLRLPELLTSSSELVKIDTIMNNTSIPSEGIIAGDRAGFASAYDNGNSFDRYCEEHGVILSYLTIMPQVTYAYGASRDYSRLDQFDFAFHEFATLGMDAVYSGEITSSSLLAGGTNEVFGYQGKYYDYKAKHSEEHGELLDTQDMYTFARYFNMLDEDSRPKLNYEFVHCFPSLDMFVVDSPLADYFRYDIRHSTAAERGLPSQSIYV